MAPGARLQRVLGSLPLRSFCAFHLDLVGHIFAINTERGLKSGDGFSHARQNVCATSLIFTIKGASGMPDAPLIFPFSPTSTVKQTRPFCL